MLFFLSLFLSLSFFFLFFLSLFFLSLFFSLFLFYLFLSSFSLSLFLSLFLFSFRSDCIELDFKEISYHVRTYFRMIFWRWSKENTVVGILTKEVYKFVFIQIWKKYSDVIAQWIPKMMCRYLLSTSKNVSHKTNNLKSGYDSGDRFWSDIASQ